MSAIEEHSVLADLEARRAAVLHELAEVNGELRQSEWAQARVEERIKLLERRPRQAA